MEWVISLAALVVSVAALGHTLYTGPVLFVDTATVRQVTEDGEEHVRGILLTVFNVGRSSLPVRSVGVGPKGRDSMYVARPGTQIPGGASGDVNPAFPLTVGAGEAVVVFLTMEIEDHSFLKIEYMSRGLLLRPKRKWWTMAIEPGMRPTLSS
ncbi:hypothetical protein [Microbacterium sp. PA5]|uniref:hypothetical protein n=1 Tax=Microbacterium sp. PA5 TaxID=3416654 RepID=UPI003CF4ACF7